MARILCVDDAKSIRQLLSMIIEGMGHEVLTADDGDTAMELARDEPVDLVLSDVNMPKVSGPNLVGRLRRLDHYADTPIVMVTTESDGYKKDKSKAAGANGWLQKPFTEEQVKKVVNHFLGS